MVKVDKARIRRAIEEAESRTSGEICVAVSPLFWGSVWTEAERAFQRLGLTATRERNGVLIFVVPSRHRFVVIGDRGVHERVGQGFWYRVATLLSERLRQEDFTSAIVAGVHAIGEGLAEHFPHRPGDTNELPDIIDERP